MSNHNLLRKHTLYLWTIWLLVFRTKQLHDFITGNPVNVFYTCENNKQRCGPGSHSCRTFSQHLELIVLLLPSFILSSHLGGCLVLSQALSRVLQLLIWFSIKLDFFAHYDVFTDFQSEWSHYLLQRIWSLLPYFVQYYLMIGLCCFMMAAIASLWFTLHIAGCYHLITVFDWA